MSWIDPITTVRLASLPAAISSSKVYWGVMSRSVSFRPPRRATAIRYPSHGRARGRRRTQRRAGRLGCEEKGDEAQDGEARALGYLARAHPRRLYDDLHRVGARRGGGEAGPGSAPRGEARRADRPGGRGRGRRADGA